VTTRIQTPIHVGGINGRGVGKFDEHGSSHLRTECRHRRQRRCHRLFVVVGNVHDGIVDEYFLQCLPMVGMLLRRRSVPTGLQRLFDPESMMTMMMIMTTMRAMVFIDSHGYFSSHGIDGNVVVVVVPGCGGSHPWSGGSGLGRGRNLSHHQRHLVKLSFHLFL
jgi:hypothetical protein